MEGLGGEPDWVKALHLFQSSLDTKAPSKIMSAWMLWRGQNGVRRNRLKARTMCEEVLTTQDLEDQLKRWEAVGWTWPAALEWFRGKAWRAHNPFGKAVESGKGESGLLQEWEGNGRATFAPVREGALSETCKPGDNAQESRGALGPGRSFNRATLRRSFAGAVTIAVAVTVAVSRARPRSSRL
jgi:hypothetical protein